MYGIAYTGSWETLPEAAAAICGHDTLKLEALLQGGLDLDIPVELGECIKLAPLEIAVFRNDAPMIRFLLERGANPALAQEQPLLLAAARCCGPEVVALSLRGRSRGSTLKRSGGLLRKRAGADPREHRRAGASGHCSEKVWRRGAPPKLLRRVCRARQALARKRRLHQLPQAGHGLSLCLHPRNRSRPIQQFRHGALSCGAGADITIADKCGERPYTVALQNKNQEMAEYLKALEPERWRNEQEKARKLMPYKMPAKMQECLKSGLLRLEFPEQKLAKWAELYPLLDVQEMAWKRKKLLSLMARMDNCSDCLLLWNPGDKKLWFLDAGHEEFCPLAKWDDFIADSGRYLNGMVAGEFDFG